MKWPHIHWWRKVRAEEAWRYFACRCGSRRARFRWGWGYSPVDLHWVETGEWFDPAKEAPPTGPSPLRVGWQR